MSFEAGSNSALSLLLRCEELKGVERHTKVMTGSRHENSAEHSWHASLAGYLLRDYEPAGLDRAKAMSMLLLHELVEIEAGDHDVFGTGIEGRQEKEVEAAKVLFGASNSEVVVEIDQLWNEFEFGDTTEAKWCRAVDAFMPMLVNIADDGAAWKGFVSSRDTFLEKKSHIKDGSEALWQLFLEMTDYSVERGWLEA